MKVKEKEKKETSTEKEKTEKKYFSRKFIVWIIASVFVVLGFVLSMITKSETQTLSDLIQWWGWVSVIYIGGNVAQKKIPSFEKDAEGEK